VFVLSVPVGLFRENAWDELSWVNRAKPSPAGSPFLRQESSNFSPDKWPGLASTTGGWRGHRSAKSSSSTRASICKTWEFTGPALKDRGGQTEGCAAYCAAGLSVWAGPNPDEGGRARI